MPHTNLKAYAKLHLIIFIWGFTAVLGALIQLDFLPLTWYRMGLASLFLLIYILLNKNQRRLLLQSNFKTQMRYLIGGIIIALHWLAFFYAIKISNVSITLVTLSSGAFFTSILEPVLFKRKVYFHEILLGILILGGFMILLKVEKIELTGVYFALIAAFLSGLFSVINGLYIQQQNGIQLSFFQLFYGFLFLSLILLFNNQLEHIPKPSLTDWIYLIILASVCTAYAFTQSISLMKYLSPYTVMLSINLEPVYGIILAVLVLGDKEKMTPGFYLGASIILIIIILNAYIKYRYKKAVD
ncbi:MAG TPA: DMT family transporter [Thiomicrospira sp.]|nr:DMT family transporter [Thiomicrospira sp.]